MDVQKWIRDPSKLHGVLKELADTSVICEKPVKIYFPVRFADRSLAIVGTDTSALGMFAIVLDDQYYAVSRTCATINLDPDNINTIKIGGESYYELEFDAGSTVFRTTELVMNDAILYNIYDEIIAKGNVPWYFEYEDICKLFSTSEEFANKVLGANHAILELIASLIVRSKDDVTKYYRQTFDERGHSSSDPKIIPLRNVMYGATNTVARLIGAYSEEGKISALVYKTNEVEITEAILRS